MNARAALASLMIAAIAITTAPAAAAQFLSVTATHPLDFGDTYRRMSRTIRPHDVDAARFEVTADAGRILRVWVSIVPASARAPIPSGHSSRPHVDVEIDNDFCELSVDGGRSWQRFETGALSHDLRVPPNGQSTASPSRLLVRVGGRVVVGDDQKRGEYGGRVILTAMYLDAPPDVE